MPVPIDKANGIGLSGMCREPITDNLLSDGACVVGFGARPPHQWIHRRIFAAPSSARAPGRGSPRRPRRTRPAPSPWRRASPHAGRPARGGRPARLPRGRGRRTRPPAPRRPRGPSSGTVAAPRSGLKGGHTPPRSLRGRRRPAPAARSQPPGSGPSSAARPCGRRRRALVGDFRVKRSWTKAAENTSRPTRS